MERIVGDKYKLGRKIGSGSFGEIFLATHVDTHEIVAVKMENRQTKHPQLLYEAKLYNYLQGIVGIASIHWSGVDVEDNVLVLDLLGPSLEDLFVYCGRKFSLKTVLMLADQMLTRIELMHAKGFLHRDLKPDNFLMGLGRKANQVYVIDFGLAKRYRDPTTSCHIPYNLPWQGLKGATKKQKYDKICEKKVSTPIEVLCKNHHVEFASYFQYCRSLTFDQRPDYGFLKRLFRDLFTREGFDFDYVFDWTILKHQQSEKNKPQNHSTSRAVPGVINRPMPVHSNKRQGVNDDSYQIGATDRRRSSNMMMTRPNENISLGKHLTSPTPKASTSFSMGGNFVKPDEPIDPTKTTRGSTSWIRSLHRNRYQSCCECVCPNPYQLVV
ncbi:unnamed protein product [Lactuca saligna]|uniref:non-specific serine/threonine protein kinase n=1 Tax=Lactuca saligna TaxID=75948 RepID=A0AA36E6S5_LACSI|nr:unnamed protein product [Lactuca saligna]